jgi:hypothetical protein
MKIFAATVAVLAASASASAAPSWSWKTLHRPLKVPRIAPGKPCPVSARRERLPGGLGPGFGGGPAWPVGIDNEGRPVLRYQDPILPQSSFYGTGWFGNKVLWLVDPKYRGPVLIRGRQLDGPNPVRFEEGGRKPPLELRIAASQGRPPGGRPSYTRVRAPGCYGYQVDGTNFSRVIVFEARPYSA